MHYIQKKTTHLILYFIGVGIMPAGVVLTINAHLGAGGYERLWKKSPSLGYVSPSQFEELNS